MHPNKLAHPDFFRRFRIIRAAINRINMVIQLTPIPLFNNSEILFSIKIFYVKAWDIFIMWEFMKEPTATSNNKHVTV